jgi:hypothetical protein
MTKQKSDFFEFCESSIKGLVPPCRRDELTLAYDFFRSPCSPLREMGALKSCV